MNCIFTFYLGRLFYRRNNILKLKNITKKLFTIFIASFLIGAIFLLSSCSFLTSDEHIFTSISPDKTYTLEAYKVNGGATTDYSIKVYRLSDNTMFGKTLIYNKYHDYNAEIKWINNDTVSI
ncbi:MAG: hypothetical protein J1E85_10160 [Ruminococcus sp.]|nr:hypothetical protein [Ruminococcus sp.]